MNPYKECYTTEHKTAVDNTLAHLQTIPSM